jgi:hypothetical protein
LRRKDNWFGQLTTFAKVLVDKQHVKASLDKKEKSCLPSEALAKEALYQMLVSKGNS